MRSVGVIAAAIVFSCAIGGTALAQSGQGAIHGTWTLYGTLQPLIADLDDEYDLEYGAEGSALGESDLVSGEHNVAPLSRPLTPQAIAALEDQGVVPVQNVIALTSMVLYVRADQSIREISIPVIRDIYRCQVRDWSQVPNSGKSGPIDVFRPRDFGKTEVFFDMVGITSFGSCVVGLYDDELALETALNPDAIGYSNLQHLRVGENKRLAVSPSGAPGTFVAPSYPTTRNLSYPLARRLYFVTLSGSGRVATEAEEWLTSSVMDRNLLERYVLPAELVMCSSSGCP